MLERNKIYDLDCFDFLSKIDDEVVDLAVIDPPYNLKKASWDTFNDDKEYFDFTFRWIDALVPKLKKSGSLYIFNTPYNASFILSYLVNRGLIFQNWITWDKRDGFSATKQKFNIAQETILFFTKSKHHVFNYNDIRLPYESTERIEHARKKGILKNGKRWFPNERGKLCTDIWHVASERHKHKVNGKIQKLQHVTPKPLELIERIIKASSNEGDLVLDCFVGIGTTAIAAVRLKREFICSDSNIEYVRIAQENLDKVINGEM